MLNQNMRLMLALGWNGYDIFPHMDITDYCSRMSQYFL